MKNYIITALLLPIISVVTFLQQTNYDRQTIESKVADIFLKLTSSNLGDNDENMQEYADLGEFTAFNIAANFREISGQEPYSVSSKEKKEGFVPLFNGINLDGWVGNTVDYLTEDGMLVCRPSSNGKGNLFTKNKYRDFILRFKFQLTPGADNGLGIRMPKINKKVAYKGIELQILDNDAEIYNDLKPYHYHGSVYGVIPAKRGYLNPVGEWNFQEVQITGNQIKITLNGEVILDADITEAIKEGAPDGKKHPGLTNKTGHIAFLGHGSPVKFMNIRIKNMDK